MVDKQVEEFRGKNLKRNADSLDRMKEWRAKAKKIKDAEIKK